jgi:LPS-assembly protein
MSARQSDAGGFSLAAQHRVDRRSRYGLPALQGFGWLDCVAVEGPLSSLDHRGNGIAKAPKYARASGFPLHARARTHVSVRAVARSCASMLVALLVVLLAGTGTAHAVKSDFEKSFVYDQQDFLDIAPAPSTGPQDKTPPRGTRVDVDADQIVFDDRANTAVATGNVVMTYGNYVLIARRVTYNQDTDTMRAEGEIRLREPGGNILEADVLELQNRFRDGFAEHLRLLLTNEAVVTASYAKRRDGYLTVYDRTTYTRCRTCVTDAGTPAWQLVASQTTHDEKERTLYHRDARLELLGVPVFYWPYLSHPDPTVNRRTGFLIPRFSHSSVFGYGYEQPYFVNIAPNMDLTLMPKWTTEQGPLMRAEFRHRLANGYYSVQGAGAYQLNPDQRPAPGDEEWRGWLRTQGKFNINRWWQWGWDGTIVSDDTFGREYDFDERTEIASYIYLDGIHGRNYTTVRAYNFQGLLQTDDQDTFPTAAPYFRHDYTFDFPVLGGELGLNTDMYALVRNMAWVPYDTNPQTLDVVQGTRQLRATSQLHWRKEIVTDPGVIITPFARVRGDLLVSDNVPTQRIDNSVPLVLQGQQTDGRILPSGGLDMRMPLAKSDQLGTHVLTPIAQIITSKNEGDLSKWGNEDAISLNYTATNLFLENRFSGNDRYEGGTRINAGFLYTLGFPEGGSFNASFGQSYHIAGQNSFVAGSGLNGTNSDLVGAVWFQPDEYWKVSYQARFDPDSLSMREQDIGVAATFDRLKTALNYVKVEEAVAYGRPNNQEQIWGYAEIGVGGGISVFGGARYDIITDQFIDREAGIAFACDCMNLRFRYKEDFLTDRNTDRNRSFLLDIELVTLGSSSIGSSVSGN